MSRFLITGANGQLGKSIQDAVRDAKLYSRFIFVGHKELDITDEDAVTKFMETNEIEAVVNCAAYTNVAMAETEEGSREAYECNCEGVRVLTKACQEKGIYLIHISTDYVFDGTKNTPYLPSDNRNPLNEYGRTKMYGEDHVLSYGKGIVFRTSWLFSEYGKNFLTTMADRVNMEKETHVVTDQIGNPTYAGDLARFIVRILAEEKYKGKSGAYHFTNSGSCSWYDLASFIEYQLLVPSVKYSVIRPTTSVNYFTDNVARPSYSVLNTEKLADFGVECPRSWIWAVEECCYRNLPEPHEKERSIIGVGK